MQYKENIIQLTNQNATLNKKLKSLSSIEQKYNEVVQQNEVYETELKELEETVKLVESQLDREQCVSLISMIFRLRFNLNANFYVATHCNLSNE